MKIRKILIATLAVVPLLMVLAVYSKLPGQVPLHWGIDGNVDRYGDKSELFLMAGMNIFIGVLLFVLPKIDPKRRNYHRFQETYEWMILWILGFMTIIMGLTLAETMQPGRFDVGKAVCFMVGILFISLGNMLPKIKRNFFTGVKTPWALSNDTVWNKTHRLGGKCFVLGGILMLVSAVLGSGKVMFGMTIAVTGVIVVVPMVMSYVWYQKELKDAEE